MADPKIRYDIEAGITGEADVAALAQTVRALGDTLEGDLKRQANDAVDALEALGTKREAIAAFQQLTNESNALAIELAQASTNVDALARDLPAAAAAATQLAVAEAAARAQLDGATADFNEQRAALAALRAEFTGAARRTDEYREANAQLRLSVGELRANLNEKKASLQAAVSGAVAAAEAERRLAAEYERSGVALVKVRAVINDNAGALAVSADRLQAAGVATTNLVQAERELVAQTARAAAGAREFAVAQQASIAAASAAAAATKASGDALRDAFGNVGIRSVESLTAEIAQVRGAMETIRGSSTATGAEINRAFATGAARVKELERGIREATGQLTIADRAAGLFKSSMAQISAGNVVADGIGFVTNKIKEMGREFITANVRAENMQRGLAAVYGSATTAAEQIDFLRKSAGAAGVSFSGISDAFVRFSAATKASNIPLEVTNDLFASVTRAGATLGLSTERVTLVLDALAQMSSKGVVSMEELRQQLGDSLPGALSLTAKGLGITDQELIKLVESGQLAARDLFPALSKSLKELQGDTNTLTGGWSRFTNALATSAQVVGAAGGIDVMKVAIKGLAVAFGLVAVPVQAFVEVISLAVRAIGLFVDVLKGKGASEALAEFESQVQASASRINTFHASLDEAITATDASGTSVKAAAAAQGQLTSSLIASAAAQAQNATATAAAGSAASGAGNAYVQLLSRVGENVKAVEANIVASERLAKAKNDEGNAAIRTAQISGDATRVLEASSKAALDNVDAMGRVVAARQAEVDATTRTINAVTAMGVANGGLREDQAKLVGSLRQKLEVQDASLEKSCQERAELEALAAQQTLAAETYRDNSASVLQFAADLDVSRAALAQQGVEVERTRAVLEQYLKLQAQGKKTEEDVEAARRGVTRAQDGYNAAMTEAARRAALYSDALRDQIKALDLKARAQVADQQLLLAQVNASQSHLESMAAIARMQGDVTRAIDLEVQAKYKQIEAVKISAQIRELELKAAEAQIEVEKAGLSQGDALYKQKNEELEIRLQIIRTKRIEAGASADVVKGLEAEIDAIRKRGAAGSGFGGGGGGGGGSHAGGGSGSYDGFGSGGRDGYKPNVHRIDHNGARDAALAVSAAASQADREKRLGGQNAVDANLQFQLRDKLKAGSLTAADLPAIKAVVEALSQNNAVMGSADKLSAGAYSLEGRRDAAAWQATRAQLEQAAKKLESAASPRSTRHVLELKLPNGTDGSVDMASEEEAKKLMSYLGQLKGRSS